MSAKGERSAWALTPARRRQLSHTRAHLRADGPPPPRPTKAMRTLLHHELDRLMTSTCSWCMADTLRTLADRLEQEQQRERQREVQAARQRLHEGDDGLPEAA